MKNCDFGLLYSQQIRTTLSKQSQLWLCFQDLALRTSLLLSPCFIPSKQNGRGWDHCFANLVYPVKFEYSYIHYHKNMWQREGGIMHYSMHVETPFPTSFVSQTSNFRVEPRDTTTECCCTSTPPAWCHFDRVQRSQLPPEHSSQSTFSSSCGRSLRCHKAAIGLGSTSPSTPRWISAVPWPSGECLWKACWELSADV